MTTFASPLPCRVRAALPLRLPYVESFAFQSLVSFGKKNIHAFETEAIDDHRQRVRVRGMLARLPEVDKLPGCFAAEPCSELFH